MVIGLHDGVPPRTRVSRSQQATVDALRTIVPRLLSHGFECVTASDIFSEAANAPDRARLGEQQLP